MYYITTISWHHITSKPLYHITIMTAYNTTTISLYHITIKTSYHITISFVSSPETHDILSVSVCDKGRWFVFIFVLILIAV